MRVFMLSVAMALGGLSVVGAHHGGAAFDQNQSLTFKGTVTEMTFTNPHVLVYWDVTKDGVMPWPSLFSERIPGRAFRRRSAPPMPMLCTARTLAQSRTLWLGVFRPGSWR